MSIETGKPCPSCQGTGHIDFTFGERLRRIRDDNNMTQDEFARLVGLSRTQVANLELGRSQPTTTTIIIAARTFQISADDLLGITSQGEHK